MKIGQKVWVCSETLASEDKAGKKRLGQRQRGEIVYIHPLLRYVTVVLPCGSGTIRESFAPEEVKT